MNWIFIHSSLDDARLDAEAFRVLCHIARRADGSGLAFPAVKEIARTCRINKDTVCKRLRALVTDGWIERIQRSGQSSGYRLSPSPQPIRYEGVSDKEGHPSKQEPPIRPEGMEVIRREGTEGNPIRKSNKVIQRAKFDPLSDSPIPFDSPEFTAAWSEWATHRREIKKAITPTTAKKQLALLASLGEPAAIASIESSIANGWTGLFPPKTSPTNHHHPQTQPQYEKW